MARNRNGISTAAATVFVVLILAAGIGVAATINSRGSSSSSGLTGYLDNANPSSPSSSSKSSSISSQSRSSSGFAPETVLDQSISQPVSQLIYSTLYHASRVGYGAPGSVYLNDVQNYSGPLLSTNGKPILVYVGAEYCPFCAVQTWPLIMALMRFGNFTNLEYMTASIAEGDYATFTFVSSSYRSNFVVFQPYELYDRQGNPLVTLPANYTSAFQQAGRSSFPFLNFADEYVISGSVLSPAVLGTKNWTQIMSSIQAGDTLGSQITQAANVMTAVICMATGNNPASVCDQSSITALTSSLVSYAPSSTGSGSPLLVPDTPFESVYKP